MPDASRAHETPESVEHRSSGDRVGLVLAKGFRRMALPLAVLALAWGTRAFPIGAQEAKPPSIPIEVLERAGSSGSARPGGEPVRIESSRHGVLVSGWALPVDPGESFEFEILPRAEGTDRAWTDAFASGTPLERVESVASEIPGGKLSLSPEGGFRVTAPATPGNYRFRLSIASRVGRTGQAGRAETVSVMELWLLVRTPFDRTGNGVIGGFPIGIYPNENGREVSSFVEQNRGLYLPPASFIHVTPEVVELQVSEHYRLADFVPPTDRGKTSYLALSPRLIEYLEAAIADLRQQIGGPEHPRPLAILSAFLSPNQLRQYEASGIRLTTFTRYQYGDGAAVIWDADGDGRMDDMNRDGRIDIEDARTLGGMLADVQKKLGKFGGIGAEAAPRLPFMPDTPYVDVDMRGVASRW